MTQPRKCIAAIKEDRVYSHAGLHNLFNRDIPQVPAEKKSRYLPASQQNGHAGLLFAE